MELKCLISMNAASKLHVLMMCFHRKIAIKDEAKVVDDSNKANISIAETDCLLSADK